LGEVKRTQQKTLRTISGKEMIKNKLMNYKVYRITDDKKQEEDALRYWASKSIKKKMDAMEQIIKNFYEVQGTNLHEQRLQRVLKIVKLSQS
jgi:uncharacterized protein YdaU (DUF1376 family)